MKDITSRLGREQIREKGATLVMVAFALAMILGAAALSIDLAALYVQRSEAQRAADAGALAGAMVFTGGCTLDSSCLGPTATAEATAQATQAAQQNMVFGQTPTIPSPVFTAGGGSSFDPLITVTVQAPAKTFFLPLSAGTQISAQATAEAYNPSGSSSGPVFCASCVKPFFVPNCDPNHLTLINPNCPTTAGYFFNGNTLVNGTSIVGQTWQLHLQTAGNQQAVPSQWLEVAFFEDPASGCSGGGTQSKTLWSQSVTQCATNQITCGTQLCTLNGNAVGPNDQAVGNLISYGNGKSNGTNAADSISCSQGTCTMTAGSGNPFAANGQTITQSGALVTVPVYDGTMQSGGGVVSVVGYMQLFIRDIQHQGQFDNIDAVIVSATTCGNMNGGAGCSTSGGGNGTGGSLNGGGSNLIPVRLVQNP
jgi:hypothetical protein